MSNCRTSRCQLAPSAVRTATSFCLPVARVSSRLATLAHAMSSTSVTEPITTSTASRTLPTTDSTSGTTSIVNVRSRLIFFSNPAGNGRDVALRQFVRHARLQTRHDVEVLIAPALDLRLRAEGQRKKDVHLPDAGNGRHDLAVQQEVRPEHADDLVLVAWHVRILESVQRDELAHDARIGAERAAPECVTEDNDGRVSQRVLLRAKEPSVEWRRAQQVKQARRRLEPFDALRPVLRGRRISRAREQCADAAVRDRHFGKRAVLLLDVEVLSGRRPVLRDVDPWRPQPQHNQSIGVRIWQRLQQQRVDDAEDRGVGADPDRERRDDQERQPCASSQRANGVADVMHRRNSGAFRRWCTAGVG